MMIMDMEVMKDVTILPRLLYIGIPRLLYQGRMAGIYGRRDGNRRDDLPDEPDPEDAAAGCLLRRHRGGVPEPGPGGTDRDGAGAGAGAEQGKGKR